jgi:Flp pilus assembly protein CpaB
MQLAEKSYRRRDWRNVLGTRRGTVLVGLGCAALAGALLVGAMARYRSSLTAGNKPMTVLVATQRIPKNTPGDVIASQSLFRATEIAASQVTAGAVADAAVIRGKVAVRDILPGEQMTAADFGNGGLPAELSPAERAVVVSLDPQHGMVGSIHDGDRVDVYGSILVQGNLGRPTPVERVVVRNVRVIHAGSGGGSNAGLAGTSSTDTSNVTLDMPEGDVGVLTFAQDYGKVWLVLRGSTAANTNVPSPITVDTFLLGTAPLNLGGLK